MITNVIDATIDKLINLYEKAPEVKDWAESHQPNKDLLYKAGFYMQAKEFSAVHDLTSRCDGYPRVISTHASKSVGLPVVLYSIDYFYDVQAFIIMRNNFYDVKFSVVSEAPIHIPYKLIHREWTYEEFEAEKKRSFDYCSKSSKFDPSKYETDAWYDDWNRHSIILKEKHKIWTHPCVYECYCEGYSDLNFPDELFMPYKDEMKIFTIHTSIEIAPILMKNIFYSLEEEQMQINLNLSKDEEDRRYQEYVEKQKEILLVK